VDYFKKFLKTHDREFFEVRQEQAALLGDFGKIFKLFL